ncbi:MAG: hypothetical protein AB7P23_09715 [Amphiplicatus sp.]
MAALPDSVRLATKAYVDGGVTDARILFEATGAGGTTVDIAKRVAAKENAMCFYGGAPVDLADITITADTPSAGQTRFTFGFTLETGVKIKIFA